MTNPVHEKQHKFWSAGFNIWIYTVGVWIYMYRSKQYLPQVARKTQDRYTIKEADIVGPSVHLQVQWKQWNGI